MISSIESGGECVTTVGSDVVDGTDSVLVNVDMSGDASIVVDMMKK